MIKEITQENLGNIEMCKEKLKPPVRELPALYLSGTIYIYKIKLSLIIFLGVQIHI